MKERHTVQYSNSFVLVTSFPPIQNRPRDDLPLLAGDSIREGRQPTHTHAMLTTTTSSRIVRGLRRVPRTDAGRGAHVFGARIGGVRGSSRRADAGLARALDSSVCLSVGQEELAFGEKRSEARVPRCDLSMTCGG